MKEVQGREMRKTKAVKERQRVEVANKGGNGTTQRGMLKEDVKKKR